MVVLGISGSLRRGSYNGRLLAAAAGALPAGAELEEWRGLAGIPPYDADLDVEPAPEGVEELRGALRRADAVLIATPEYNHSVPGQLKNALDWASRPFPDNSLRGRPVAVVGASASLFGAVWAQAELRKILAATGARVIDEELPVPSAHDAFDPDDGSLLDHALRAALAGILEQLVEAVRASAPREVRAPLSLLAAPSGR